LSFQICNTLAHTEGISVVFCIKPKVSKVSKRRVWWTDGVEAHVTTQAEARSRRGHASHQPKVAMSVQHMAALHWPVKSGVLI
jgi:hypothetical protein